MSCRIDGVSSLTSACCGESGEVEGAKEGVSGGVNSCEGHGGVGPVSASPFGRNDSKCLVYGEGEWVSRRGDCCSGSSLSRSDSVGTGCGDSIVSK